MNTLGRNVEFYTPEGGYMSATAFTFSDPDLAECVDNIRAASKVRYGNLDSFNADLAMAEKVLAKYANDPNLEIDCGVDSLLGDAGAGESAWIAWNVMKQRIVFIRSGENVNGGEPLANLSAKFRVQCMDANVLRRLLEDAANLIGYTDDPEPENID